MNPKSPSATLPSLYRRELSRTTKHSCSKAYYLSLNILFIISPIAPLSPVIHPPPLVFLFLFVNFYFQIFGILIRVSVAAPLSLSLYNPHLMNFILKSVYASLLIKQKFIHLSLHLSLSTFYFDFALCIQFIYIFILLIYYLCILLFTSFCILFSIVTFLSYFILSFSSFILSSIFGF